LCGFVVFSFPFFSAVLMIFLPVKLNKDCLMDSNHFHIDVFVHVLIHFLLWLFPFSIDFILL
jgi:hypothetical protein